MPTRKLTIPILYPPPVHCAVPSRPDPLSSGSQEAIKLKSVLDHFSSAGLPLAAKEGGSEKRGLEDVEKMYLVSRASPV